MKNIIFFVLLSLAVASCGGNSTDNSKRGPDSSGSTNGSATNQPSSDLGTAVDTSAVQGKGTDKIPSRTGTTGQGNTTVTGAATGSPTGTGKDTSRK